ncbi:vWA domain-containing protein [Nocardia takedensis]
MTVLPVYILADRSASMAASVDPHRTAIDVVNEKIRELLDRMSRDPSLTRDTRVSVISFAQDATIDLPLTRLGAATRCPTLTASGLTSFAAAFRTTTKAIETDTRTAAAERSPAVFMLTDGYNNAPEDAGDVWRVERQSLLRAAGTKRPVHLIPFCTGRCNRDVLAQLGSDPTARYIASRSDSPVHALDQFGELIYGSVVSSVVTADHTIVVPDGSRVHASEE